MTAPGHEPTLLDAMARSKPTRTAVVAMLVALISLALFSTVLGAGLVHAHVSTSERIQRVLERVDPVEKMQRADHDRLARIEAQLEYLAKLTLIQINDQRMAAGKTPLPDEFPRDADGGQ